MWKEKITFKKKFDLSKIKLLNGLLEFLELPGKLSQLQEESDVESENLENKNY